MDAVGLGGVPPTFLDLNEGWKPWTTFDGTPVLVPELFNTEPNENGEILMYPEGDKSASPCAKMPNGGLYFDTIVRQPPIDDATLNVEDNLEEFGPIPEFDLEVLKRKPRRSSADG